MVSRTPRKEPLSQLGSTVTIAVAAHFVCLLIESHLLWCAALVQVHAWSAHLYALGQQLCVLAVTVAHLAAPPVSSSVLSAECYVL